MSAAPGTRPHVVIVGGGFGGLWAGRTLAGEDVDVTLLDRRNYHTFFPLLYQVAAAELAPADIAYPIRSIFRKAPNVSVQLAEVFGVDLERRVVRTSSEEIPYDALVLAPGSESNFFGVEGADRYAFPLRWMDDAIPLCHHVLRRFEAAEGATGDLRRRLLTFVVVGGGPTGVEYAGALSELVHGPLLRDFRGITPGEIDVVLVEAGPTVLAGMPEELARYAIDRLERRGVEVRVDTTVEAVTPTEVRLRNGGVIGTETVVWSAGVRGDPRVKEWGLPTGRGGRVPVTPELHLAGRPEVFVVGDLAWLEEEGRPLPQVAQVAIQQGKHAAANILREIRGQRPTPFRYRDLGMLAVIGRNAAVAEIGRSAFTGFVAWVIWLTIHITWLVGFRNRALVLVNWAWNYFLPRRAVRLILPTSDDAVRALAPPGRARVRRPGDGGS